MEVESDLDLVGPSNPPNPSGGSTWASPDEMPVTGNIWKLPEGTNLPEGLGLFPDGVNYNLGGDQPAWHNTILPTESMTFYEFKCIFNTLPWEWHGKR